MRFEKEVNIYGDEVILKRFQANETSIEVVQGKISALISESELIELENSQATMYSKLASAIMDIDSLDLQFSELNTKYNTVSGQYTQLDSKLTQVEISVNGLSANVSQVSQNLSDNYSTTIQMQSAIDMRIDAYDINVSKTYATRTDMNTANGKIDELETWKSEASLKIADSAIISTVINSSSYESSVDSLIEQKADSIRMKANTIAWESLYSSMTADGTLTCRNAAIEGTLHNDNGNDEIYIRDANLQFYDDGIFTGYIGTAYSANDRTKKALSFRLRGEGSYMAWSSQENDSNIIKWYYTRYSNLFQDAEADTLNAGCDINMHNFTLKSARLEKISSGGHYGQTGYLPVVIRYSESGVDIETVVDLEVSNGIIIGGLLK